MYQDAPKLVIMAAGMGSRFGGLKQMEPVDDEGHSIIDFSMYDARRAGFRNLVFIIKREHEALFRERIGDRMERFFNVEYVYQELTDIPAGCEVPEGRIKPWGTGQAVACCRNVLHDFEGTVVAITHDRYFLDNVAGWILELDRGEGIPWEGNYSSWLEQKDQRLAQEASQEAARRKSIEKELEWVRQGTKGRQSKGKARLARFEELNSTEYQKRNETNELFIPPGPRLGDKVLEVSNLRKSYGDRLLIDDLSFSIPKGAIVGIIGPNGAGKSTLFRMISGQEQPDSGTITLGETVKLASVDQFRDSMDNSKTVWEEVSGGLDIMKIGNTEMPSRAYVGRFNFKGVDQGKRVGELSGGERGRLHLAKLLQVGGNMLLLDEPTNDLDIETLRALENALLEFPGCAMVISHDRWFLDRIATHILDYQDEGKVEFFEGNFTEYEEYKKRTLGADALEPKRIKYKRIAK